MDKLKYLIAILGGLAATALKLYAPMFIAVIVVLIFDFITGIIAANVSGERWNSEKARKGVVKKGTMLLQLLFGIALDYIIPAAVEQGGLAFDFGHLLFSNVIGFYIIFTEAVSICENFYKCNPDAFPKWIVKFLTAGKEQIDKLGEGIVKESDEK